MASGIRVPNFAAIASSRPINTGLPLGSILGAGIADAANKIGEGLVEGQQNKDNLLGLAELTTDPKEKAIYMGMADAAPLILAPGGSKLTGPAGLFGDKLKELMQEKESDKKLSQQLALQNNSFRNQLTLTGIHDAAINSRAEKAFELRLKAEEQAATDKLILENFKAERKRAESEDPTLLKNVNKQKELEMKQAEIDNRAAASKAAAERAIQFHKDSMGIQERRLEQADTRAEERIKPTYPPEKLKEWEDMLDSAYDATSKAVVLEKIKLQKEQVLSEKKDYVPPPKSTSLLPDFNKKVQSTESILTLPNDGGIQQDINANPLFGN